MGKSNFSHVQRLFPPAPASYKGCEARKQLQRKLFPPQRNRTYTDIQVQQDSAKPETIPNTEHAINTKHISTNTFGSRNYAQVTSQSTHSDNQTTTIVTMTLQKSKNCSNNPSPNAGEHRKNTEMPNTPQEKRTEGPQ